MRLCSGCHEDFFGWWCARCDRWPCLCVGEADGDAQEEATSVPEEAVPVAGGGTVDAAADAVDAAGTAGVPVREASAPDVASDEEVAWVSVEDHDPVGCIVDELRRGGASGAVVAQDGSLDDLVDNMIAEGYTLGETVYVHGKRIRYLIPPGGESSE